MAGNPFHDWLGLDPKIKNPHHFQLLGVSSKVVDAKEYRAKVTTSAKAKLSLLKKLPADADPKLVAQLKSRIRAAHEILSSDQKRAEYVLNLKSKTKANNGKASPAGAKMAPVVQPRPDSPSPASANLNPDLLPPAAGKVVAKPVAVPVEMADVSASNANLPPESSNAPQRQLPATAPIPLAVPIGRPTPSAIAASPAKEVAVNLDGVPIDDVKIDRKRKTKRKSIVPKIILGFLLLAGIGGAAAVYLNWEQLMQIGGIDPEQVALGPNAGRTKLADDGDANTTNKAEDDEPIGELSDVDLEDLEELNVDEVMGHAATIEVIGIGNTGLDRHERPMSNEMMDGQMTGTTASDAGVIVKPNAPAVTRPTKSLPPADVEAIKRRVDRARRSMLRSDDQTASQELAKAQAVLTAALGAEFDIDEEQRDVKSIVAGAFEAAERLAGFRKQVISSCKGISGGQEIRSGGKVLGFVEARDDVVILKNAGALISYDYKHLRPGLAMALGEQGAIRDIPTWRLEKAAMYGLYVAEDSENVNKAEELISLSEQDGHDGTNLRNFVTIEIPKLGGAISRIDLESAALAEMIAKVRQAHDYQAPAKVERGVAESLAKKMIEEIPQSQIEQAATLSQARSLAVHGLNAYLVEDAVAALEAIAKIDAPKLLVDSYAAIAKQKLDQQQARRLMETAIPFVKSKQAASVNEKLTNLLAKRLLGVAKQHGLTDSVIRIEQFDSNE